MNHQKFIVILLCSICCYSSYGQKGKRQLPNKEEIAKAKTLKESYEEDDVVALNSLQAFEFSIEKSTKKVKVAEVHKERLMGISPQHTLKVAKFYDAESSIKKPKVFYKNGGKASPYVADDYYNTADFFYSDARVVHINLDFKSQGFQYQVNFEKEYKDIKYFPTAYFATRYPIQKKEFRFVIPRWLNLELKEVNFDNYDISKTVEYDKKKDADVYTFIANNLPSVSDEGQTPGPSYIYPHILILAKSFQLDGKKVALFESTQDLYNWYKSLVTSMEDNPSVIEAKTKELIANAKADIDKVRAIYYWVQDNIRYIAFEDGIAGFKPEECQEVFTKKYGDCKGMANLTKQMLQIAGFDARLTWIGTKRIAYDYSLPSLAVDNHMICTVIIDGEKYFLDPTEKYNSFSDYAERIQGRQVLIEDGEKFLLAKVPVLEKSDNLEQLQQQLTINEEKLEGTATRRFNGESRAYFLYIMNQIKTDRKEDALLYYINSGDKNFQVPKINTSDINNRDQLFEINYDLKLNNVVSSFGDDIYIDIDYDKEYGRFVFEEDRQNDYIFEFKKQLAIETELAIPTGYQISELPKGMKEIHPDFSFVISYEQKGGKLVYRKNISIDHAIVRKKDFELWNKCVEQLKNCYQEQIVLTKKS